MDHRLALALKYLHQGLLDPARDALRALTMDLGPAVAPHLFELAAAFRAAGRLAEAEQAYRDTLALAPGNAPSWNNLGLVLDDLGRPDDAVAAFTRAVACDPAMSSAYNNLGAAHAGQGRYVAAAEAYRAALIADPGNIGAQTNLGAALLEQGDVAGAVQALDAACRAAPDNCDAADNRLYLDIYRDADPIQVCARHRAWGQRFAAPPPMQRTTPRGPLKVGYVSADFRRHSVAFFIEALLAHHDPAAVTVFCYADVAQPDAVTARLKAYVPHWRDCAGWDDARLAQVVQADGIDILVDLAGHTMGNRLGVFARRAAPVQITGLGYPATTGLPAMDYRFCDSLTDPEGAEAQATERLLRLPALHCFTPPAAAPPVASLPAQTNGYVTFGSFNKRAKISESCVRLWAAVLNAIPTARLVLKSKPLAEAATQDALAAGFAAHGITRDRLDLWGWRVGDTDHLRAYDGIDIALDTVPYNGTTTTCEALYMGVPVLTLAGHSHAGRVGVSLLTHVGLPTWIADSEADFRDCALAACADLDGLAALRAALRARLQASRLCDGATYARDVEAAYRGLFSADNSAG